MIVLDASAALECILRTSVGQTIAETWLRKGSRLHAPHLVDIEVAQVLRRLTLSKQIGRARADEARRDWLALAMTRHEHTPLLDRMFELRASLTAYDACYVALAEGLGAPLLTTDQKLGRSHGHSAKIVSFARGVS